MNTAVSYHKFIADSSDPGSVARYKRTKGYGSLCWCGDADRTCAKQIIDP